METVIQIRRDSAYNWESANPVLSQGELALELDTGMMKVGDGVRKWTALPYSGESANLDAHINSPLPHPVYDSGPSLVLLYENAKV